MTNSSLLILSITKNAKFKSPTTITKRNFIYFEFGISISAKFKTPNITTQLSITQNSKFKSPIPIVNFQKSIL